MYYRYVLEQILSGEAAEIVVENIHEYLSTISQNVRDGQVKVDDFIVFKVRFLSSPFLPHSLVLYFLPQRLGKDPDAYPDAKSQPHVQVALRMKARGASARNGDIIPYIFCIAEGEESAKSAQADRAKHPDELKKAGSGLKIGACFSLLANFHRVEVLMMMYGRLHALPIESSPSAYRTSVRADRRHG